MTDKIEQVARAISEANDDWWQPENRQRDEKWKYALARAAIEAADAWDRANAALKGEG